MWNLKFWRNLQTKSLRLLYPLCPPPGRGAAASETAPSPAARAVPLDWGVRLSCLFQWTSAGRFRGQTAHRTSNYSAAQHLEHLPGSGRTQLLLLRLALSQPAGPPGALGAGSPPSLVPTSAVKWRSLPRKKFLQNSNVPRNVPPQQNPKILLTLALSDEKQFSDEKWFSGESIQLIFTVRMSAWLLRCDRLLEGLQHSLPLGTGMLPWPPTDLVTTIPYICR